MRSLWQDLAMRWLGGEGSAALAGEISFLDRFPIAAEPRPPAFLVERRAAVSHRAMLRASDEIADRVLPAPAE